MSAFIAGTIITYLVASSLLLVRAGKGRAADMMPRWPALLIAFAAVIQHAVILKYRIYLPDGLALDIANVFSLMAWQIALLWALLSLRPGTANLGIALYPLVAASLLPLLFTAPERLIGHTSWQLEAHILLSVLAYGLLGLAAFQAVLLAVQEHLLRHHRPGGLLRALPPLTVMESLLFQTLAAGLALLSLALFSGLIFIENMFAQHLAHKTVLSIFSWLVFAVLLFGRRRFGWRGRTAIRWTLSGFLLLALAYFGSKLVLEEILGLHWG